MNLTNLFLPFYPFIKFAYLTSKYFIAVFTTGSLNAIDILVRVSYNVNALESSCLAKSGFLTAFSLPLFAYFNACPGQDEGCRNATGGPHPLVVQHFGMIWGKE